MSVVTTYYADVRPLTDPVLYNKAYSKLPEFRKRKADGFVFQKDRCLSVGAWTLLCIAVQDLGEDSEGIKIGYIGNGKPVLEGMGIRFNLSHSGQRVMCSISGSEVGCDVEEILPIDLDIARKYFFGTEYDTIVGSEDPTDMFYRFWTLKESFMKVTGLGMELPLDAFRITLEDPIRVDQDVSGDRFHFREYHMDDGYRYSVCSTSDEFQDTMIKTDLTV